MSDNNADSKGTESRAGFDSSTLELKKIGPFWVLILGKIKTKLPKSINTDPGVTLKVTHNSAYIVTSDNSQYEVILNDGGTIVLKAREHTHSTQKLESKLKLNDTDKPDTNVKDESKTDTQIERDDEHAHSTELGETKFKYKVDKTANITVKDEFKTDAHIEQDDAHTKFPQHVEANNFPQNEPNTSVSAKSKGIEDIEHETVENTHFNQQCETKDSTQEDSDTPDTNASENEGDDIEQEELTHNYFTQQAETKDNAQQKDEGNHTHVTDEKEHTETDELTMHKTDDRAYKYIDNTHLTSHNDKNSVSREKCTTEMQSPEESERDEQKEEEKGNTNLQTTTDNASNKADAVLPEVTEDNAIGRHSPMRESLDAVDSRADMFSKKSTSLTRTDEPVENPRNSTSGNQNKPVAFEPNNDTTSASFRVNSARLASGYVEEPGQGHSGKNSSRHKTSDETENDRNQIQRDGDSVEQICLQGQPETDVRSTSETKKNAYGGETQVFKDTVMLSKKTGKKEQPTHRRSSTQRVKEVRLHAMHAKAKAENECDFTQSDSTSETKGNASRRKPSQEYDPSKYQSEEPHFFGERNLHEVNFCVEYTIVGLTTDKRTSETRLLFSFEEYMKWKYFHNHLINVSNLNEHLQLEKIEIAHGNLYINSPVDSIEHADNISKKVVQLIKKATDDVCVERYSSQDCPDVDAENIMKSGIAVTRNIVAEVVDGYLAVAFSSKYEAGYRQFLNKTIQRIQSVPIPNGTIRDQTHHKEAMELDLIWVPLFEKFNIHMILQEKFPVEIELDVTEKTFRVVISGLMADVLNAKTEFMDNFENRLVKKEIVLKIQNFDVFRKTDILVLVNAHLKKKQLECVAYLTSSTTCEQLMILALSAHEAEKAARRVIQFVREEQVNLGGNWKQMTQIESLLSTGKYDGVLLKVEMDSSILLVTGVKKHVSKVVNEIHSKMKHCNVLMSTPNICKTCIVEQPDVFLIMKNDDVFLDNLRKKYMVEIFPVDTHEHYGFAITGTKILALNCEDEIKQFTQNIARETFECTDEHVQSYLECKDDHKFIEKVEAENKVLVELHVQPTTQKPSAGPDAEANRSTVPLLSVVVQEGSLVEMDVNIIVNTTSSTLDLKSGAVSASILRTAGDEIQQECRNKYPNGVHVGEIAVTRGYNLKCEHVFHGSIPQYAGGMKEARSIQNLRYFVNNCLVKASEYKVATIAFPAIGTGNLGYPLEIVVDEMFNCVNRFKQNGRTSLIEVCFVIFPGDRQAIHKFRRREEFENGKQKTTSNASQLNATPNTRSVKITVVGLSKNVNLAKIQLQNKFSYDNSKSCRKVFVNIPPQVTSYLKRQEESSHQLFQNSLQRELKSMKVDVIEVDNTSLEIKAEEVADLKKGLQHIRNFCHQHFNVAVEIKDEYQMEERIHDVNADQYELFFFFNPHILKQCHKDRINIFLTDSVLVIEGPLNKVIVAKKKIHQLLDNIDTKLAREDLELNDVSDTDFVNTVVEIVQTKFKHVLLMFKPGSKNVVFYGHLKENVSNARKEFTTLLKELTLEQQQLLVKDRRTVAHGNDIQASSRLKNNANSALSGKHNKDVFCCSTEENLKIKVYVADILSISVDCIVNAANAQLDHCGGVANVIVQAAGPDLITECDDYIKRHGKLRVGTAFATNAGNLHYKCVIHAVGPCWSDFQPHTRQNIQGCQDALSDAIWCSLEAADCKQITTIAFPAVSAALFGVPKDICAAEYANAIIEYSKAKQVGQCQSLKEVHFIDKDPEVIQIIKNTFKTMIVDRKPCPCNYKVYLKTSQQANAPKGESSKQLSSKAATTYADAVRPKLLMDNVYPLYSYMEKSDEAICKFSDNHVIRIYTNSILNVTGVKVVVCSEDTSGIAKGIVAKRLVDIGKFEYSQAKREAFKERKPHVGDVVISSGGKSGYECVIHALVPHRQQFKYESEWKEAMRKMYDRIFEETAKTGYPSMVMSLIGTGAAKDEPKICAELFLDCFTVACNRHQHKPLILHMVNIEPQNTRIVIGVFKAYVDTQKRFKQADSKLLDGYIAQHEDDAGSKTTGGKDTNRSRRRRDNIEMYEKGGSAANTKRRNDTDGNVKSSKPKVVDKGCKDTADDCVICMDTMDNPTTLRCGHKFCSDCIAQQFQFKQACPTCGAVMGKITGDQPDGKMEIMKINTSLAGYQGVGSIVITYSFESGKQGANHPKPGTRYQGIKRSAYLPDNDEGRKICSMLRVAFHRKLVFTIGSSRTTGQEGVITWNDIHHKTDQKPNTQFGYPDSTYLARVADELVAKGVTEADIEKKFLSQLKSLTGGQRLYDS